MDRLSYWWSRVTHGGALVTVDSDILFITRLRLFQQTIERAEYIITHRNM